MAPETRIVAVEFGKRGGPIILYQIPEAPTVCGFVDQWLVAQFKQLGHYPSEEMGVTVVPIRNE